MWRVLQIILPERAASSTTSTTCTLVSKIRLGTQVDLSHENLRITHVSLWGCAYASYMVLQIVMPERARSLTTCTTCTHASKSRRRPKCRLWAITNISYMLEQLWCVWLRPLNACAHLICGVAVWGLFQHMGNSQAVPLTQAQSPCFSLGAQGLGVWCTRVYKVWCCKGFWSNHFGFGALSSNSFSRCMLCML